MRNFFARFSRRGFLTGAAMSALPRAGAQNGPETYKLAREVPIEKGSYDVVVAGGGPGGASAAICAARLGAKVLLLEATGCLGGMGTSALVANWYFLGDGVRMMVGGLMRELVETMCRDKQVNPGAPEHYEKGKYIDAIGYNPEALKMLLDRLCKEAGVEVRFFTRVTDADADRRKGRVNGVITSNVEGYRYIRASTFIDGTGDAMLADLCGAKSFAAGHDTPNIMPPTLCAMISDVDYENFKKASQQAMVEKAIAENYFNQPDRHVPGLFRSGVSTATMNAGHLFHTDALSCRSLSDAMVQGRRQVQEYAQFYRKYMPGCEQMQVVGTGALLGVRESRRVAGEYELSHADFQARRHFPDQIAIYCQAIDVHVYDLGPDEYKRYYEEFSKLDRLKKGENYGIPYGVLVPKGWANLWVAGRCASSDVKVNGAIRAQPACSMMGQAAGSAAVQSIRTGQPACDLNTEQLVLTLRKAGANLPQPSLASRMTRAKA